MSSCFATLSILLTVFISQSHSQSSLAAPRFTYPPRWVQTGVPEAFSPWQISSKVFDPQGLPGPALTADASTVVFANLTHLVGYDSASGKETWALGPMAQGFHWSACCGSPVVLGDTLLFYTVPDILIGPTPYSVLRAVDVKSGKEVWQHNFTVFTGLGGPRVLPSPDGSSWLSIYFNTVEMRTAVSSFGKPAWSIDFPKNAGANYSSLGGIEWSSDSKTVLVSNQQPDLSLFFYSLDAATGKSLWKSETNWATVDAVVPDTNSGKWYVQATYSPAFLQLRSVIASIDMNTGKTAFIGGQEQFDAATDFFLIAGAIVFVNVSGFEPGPFTYALMALDPVTGEARWSLPIDFPTSNGFLSLVSAQGPADSLILGVAPGNTFGPVELWFVDAHKGQVRQKITVASGSSSFGYGLISAPAVVAPEDGGNAIVFAPYFLFDGWVETRQLSALRVSFPPARLL